MSRHVEIECDQRNRGPLGQLPCSVGAIRRPTVEQAQADWLAAGHASEGGRDLCSEHRW